MNQKEQKHREFIKKALAAQNTNGTQRLGSSSGGIFSLIAEYIQDMGGYVFGAIYKDGEVYHTYSNQKQNQVPAFRGSKYVQSNLGNCFRMVKKLLEEEIVVCFSGTPCQIAGLNAFLGKAYKKLYTVDVVCFGVPSPKLFKKYIEFLEHKYDDAVKNIYFRDKTYGYASPGIKVEFQSGRIKYSQSDVKSYTKTFFRGVSTRPSCYECSFKNDSSGSDITLGDCWSIEKYNPAMDDDIGTTLVLVNSFKGENILNKLQNNMKFSLLDRQVALDADGVMVFKSSKKSDVRESFFMDIDKLDYETLIKQYVPDTWANRAADIMKPLLKKCNLVNFGTLKLIKKHKIKKDRNR